MLDLQPYQEFSGPVMTPEFTRACAEAVQVVSPDGTILSAGRAVLFMYSLLGWRRSAHFLSLPPMIWIVELFYSWVAGHREFLSRFLFRPQ